VRLANSGAFARDRRVWPVPFPMNYRRAPLVSTAIAAAAVTLAACGGGSGASLGTASLAANPAAATGNGAATTTGTTGGLATAPGSVPSAHQRGPPAAVYISQLALIGANGLVIQPAIPVNNCHMPTEAVLANLAALDWTTVN
jgi:hypothetical protein